MKKRITAAASQDLVINGIAVTCNEAGLYRLNDLHEASGELKKHQVRNWLRSQRTQDLVLQVAKERFEGVPMLEGVVNLDPALEDKTVYENIGGEVMIRLESPDSVLETILTHAPGKANLDSQERDSDGKAMPESRPCSSDGKANLKSEERASDAVLHVQRGGNPKTQGTYACRELAYDYAAWIDPAFHLKVFKAFDALAKGDTAEALEIALREDLKLSYHPMTDALKKVRAAEGKATKPFHYSNENNMIREIVTGLTASAYKQEYGKTPFRDLLTYEGREMLLWLQKENTRLILQGLSYKERKEILAAGRPAQQTMVA
ncbi:KilA domain-containing protein [Desulfobotulus alkaliphilus]|uniref:KilA domain-containing protein n=1 Tax=Desulfobotulus alkaliphilus TaxID=622671 RepID=A0A562RD26_9BACT|nr:KilA-N domain-containing protein [Desulfobotulus alkaliphilus]TWI66981.1 KilA domain-containing protein [Desulfobotulus alkaliphilus]